MPARASENEFYLEIPFSRFGNIYKKKKRITKKFIAIVDFYLYSHDSLTNMYFNFVRILLWL